MRLSDPLIRSEQPRFIIHGRGPVSVPYRSSAIVRDERVYHCVHGKLPFAPSIHVPPGGSARNENRAEQSGTRLKCSLRTFANRACAFARSHIPKPRYMKGPPAVFSATCSRFLARSDPTEALRRRLNSAQHLSCLTLQARCPQAELDLHAWRCFDCRRPDSSPYLSRSGLRRTSFYHNC